MGKAYHPAGSTVHITPEMKLTKSSDWNWHEDPCLSYIAVGVVCTLVGEAVATENRYVATTLDFGLVQQTR